jgi:hypothetical protein
MDEALPHDPLALTRVEIARVAPDEQLCRLCGSVACADGQELCPACSAWLTGPPAAVLEP